MDEQLDTRYLYRILLAITGVTEDVHGVHPDLTAKIYLQKIRDAYLGVTTAQYGDLDEKVYLQQIRDAILGVTSTYYGDLSDTVYLQQILNAIRVQTVIHYGVMSKLVYLKEILYAVQHTFYIDGVTGSDTKSGKMPVAPWKTIAKLNATTMSPGDRYLFKYGTTYVGTRLLVPNSGTQGLPIVFKAYGDSSLALPSIDGNDTVNCIDVNGQSHLYFENIDTSQGLDYGFFISGVEDISLVNCNAHDCGNDGVNFTNSFNCLVSGGKFYNTYDRAHAGAVLTGIQIADGSHDITISGAECYNGVDGAHGISVHNNTTPTTMPYNITILGCNCHNNAGVGIRVANVVNTAMTNRNIVISTNTSSLNTLDGVQVTIVGAIGQYVNGVTIKNNIFRTNVRYGISLNGDNLSCYFNEVTSATTPVNISSSVGVNFWNNTLYSTNAVAHTILAMSGARCDSISIKNNILFGTSTNAFQVGVSGGTGVTNLAIDYNLYGYTGALSRWTWIGANKDYTNWKTFNSNDANSPARADPLFVNAGGNDFTLQAGSPAINAGVNVGLPYSGVAPDCGAYEKA